MTRTADKIIVALDVPNGREALELVEQLRSDISIFKIGLQLFTAAGPESVRAVIAMGAKVFLDLKLHDIPNTVANAVKAAERLGATMLTIHLAGGREMINAAVVAKATGLELLGVTALTSVNSKTLLETGVNSSVEEQVRRLADLGVATGVDGVVASPHEIKALRTRFGDRLKIVTPGVRPDWAEPGDQRRFTTPREALQNGADYLVIGRPITAHNDPRKALDRILEEISA